MGAVLSPYVRAAANLRENGYSPMPVAPGTKVPGTLNGVGWGNLSGWQKYCKAPAPEFVHLKWETWPDAGVCIAHGSVICLDLDCDRKDVEEAIGRAIPWPACRRKGSKGWAGYYQPGTGLNDLGARIRWHDSDGNIVLELLLEGTQSVIPPTIHPNGHPYVWMDAEALTDTPVADLPLFQLDYLEKLDAALAQIGVTRKKLQRVNLGKYGKPNCTDHDLEKPFGRSVNDRAMEPTAMDRWWPALGMPKTRQRAPGAWEAVAFWRPSGSNRAVQDRNPNLKSVPGGIVDFGADRSYTPIDLVMAARDCSWQAAADWLEEYIRPEKVEHIELTAPKPAPEPQKLEELQEQHPEPVRDIWSTIPVFSGTRSYQRIKPIAQLTDAEYAALVPDDPGPFPIPDPSQCEGLLGEAACFLDAASTTATEAGGLAIALPLLGALMGRGYQTPTRLRTNVYSVAIGASGSGKTSLVSPAKELMRLGRVETLLGTDRIASGSGLLKMLDEGHAKICFLDEFGHMLKSLASYGAGVHAKQILTEFTQLYSAANTLFTGTAAATQEARQIDSPHLCLFGMATPDQFWSAFGSGALEDGSVARYLVFPLGETAPKEPDERFQQDLVDRMTEVRSAMNRRISGNLGRFEALTVPFSKEAEAERAKLIETMASCADYAERNAIKGAGPILRRVAENAAKIALISAVGRDPESPEVNRRDFDVGHALARWSANVMVSNIARHIADNQHERDVNEVEYFIQEAREKGRPYRQIQRRFRRIKTRDLRDILEGLEREGTVVVEMEQTNGRPNKIYKAA